LLILYGSDGGNAAGVAKKLGKQAKDFGFKPRVLPMDSYDFEGLPDEQNLCLVTSTAGQGEFPQNAREFQKYISTTAVDLRNVRYSVFSMGDRHYWPAPGDEHYFAKAGKDLDNRISKLGGQRLADCGIGDDQDADGWMTGYSEWMPEFWAALGVEGVGPAAEPAIAPDDNIKESSNFLRGTIAEGLQDDSTGGLKEWDQKLTKFHGIYQQDDRDIRDERKAEGLEPAVSFMVRVRLPAGVATPAQWLAMDRICEERANGTLKITTRQTFQLHGIIKKNLKKAMQEMNQALMDTIAACGDVNRNVMCGSNPDESEVHREVFEFSKKWSEHMLPKSSAYHEIWMDKKVVMSTEEVEPIYGRTFLPRKFKCVVAVPPSNDVDIYAHDLGFIAIVENGHVVGYNMTVGGGMGMTHGMKKTYPRLAEMLGYAPVDKAIDVAEKVVMVQRDYGDRTNRKHARLKYTIDDRGLDWFRGEVEARLGYKLEAARPFKFTENTDKYGWTKGMNDTWHFTFFITNGRVKDTPDQQMRTAIREIAKVHKGTFRLTANQHLMIAGVSSAEKPRIEALLEKFGIDDSKLSGLRLSSMACVALPTCGLAFAESERYLPSLITRLEESIEEAGLKDDSIVIRMTGGLRATD
jgi:sulfite reductase (NADPH) hemoprotein beta-component